MVKLSSEIIPVYLLKSYEGIQKIKENSELLTIYIRIFSLSCRSLHSQSYKDRLHRVINRKSLNSYDCHRDHNSTHTDAMLILVDHTSRTSIFL